MENARVLATRRALSAVALVAAVAGCTSSPADEGSASPAPPRPQPSTTAPAPLSSTTVGQPHSAAPPTSTAPRATVASRSPAVRIPPISARARAAGLIDIRTIIPDAVVDLRYKTSDNFVGVRLYPADARCLVHRSMRPGLITAADRLRRAGFVLVFWDCYRPHAVQVRMFKIVPNPDWVARPGPYATSHEAGRSVDVTLARAALGAACRSDRRVDGHCLLSMGTQFDDFTARAHAFATEGVSPAAQQNRALLRRAMNAGGIVVYSGEWWHFDGPGSGVARPHLGAPLS
jgi:D-alanyl-D-alanine dipeptidase